MNRSILLPLVVLLLAACNGDTGTEHACYAFNKQGALIRPTDYRSWVFAGTGTTPLSHDSTVLFPDFQNIYIDPESYRFWKENGYYREGTILVKELIRKGDTIAPIGKGYWQGEAYSLSATIKDTAHFPHAPGGWEYFKFTDEAQGVLAETSAALGAACISCHRAAKAGFGPFTELYMPLRDARGFGKGNPENSSRRKGLRPKGIQGAGKGQNIP
ncbi:MAG: cytochrome P460 family protein [Chitinophagaceae bacterium]|nr:cytochrome P460 family protein [Chitinophagaceae bacterium]